MRIATNLETTLKEILDAESQDVIELHALVIKDTDTHKTANQGVTLEETLGILLVHSQELTGSTTASNNQYPIPNIVARISAGTNRILERVSWTRQTSRLLRRPYSPTVFNSASLIEILSVEKFGDR